jgi:4-aminobutyrate aminotransferase-like enzyme
MMPFASSWLHTLSPVTGQPLSSNVFTVAAPVGESNATEFGARVRQCIEKMRAVGIQPAALLVDTIFGSDGGLRHHPYLKAAILELTDPA